MDTSVKVKLRQVLDVQEGQDPIKEFEIGHATRILNVKHPMKTWELADPKFKLEKGVITPVREILDAE